MRQHITIKDIARIAGVSTSTVSRALSNSPELSEQTRQRILEICRREGYRVNALARSLICNKTNVIGLIVPEVTNPFYAELSLGIETHARSLGYNVILCNGQNDTKVTEELFGFLISHQVDGIILASSQQDAGTMIQKLAPRLPTVLLGTPALVSGDEVNSVCIDNLAGGRLAAEHLLELGHRDIVYLGNRPNSLTHQLRLRGFTEMLEKAGITPQVIDNPWLLLDRHRLCTQPEAVRKRLFRHCDLRLDRFHGARRIAGSRRIRHLYPRGYFPARL